MTYIQHEWQPSLEQSPQKMSIDAARQLDGRLERLRGLSEAWMMLSSTQVV